MTRPDNMASSETHRLEFETGDRFHPEDLGVLCDLHLAGSTTYPDVCLDLVPFVREVDRRCCERLLRAGRPITRGNLREVIPRLHGPDLYLAIACGEQIESAWEHLSKEILPRVLEVAGFRQASGELEVISANVLGDLALPPGRATARNRLGTYLGMSRLSTWIAVILHRRVADQVRRKRREISFEEHLHSSPDSNSAHPAITAPSLDPVANAIGHETSESLQRALSAGWAELNRREQEVLLLRFRDGTAQRTIAKRFQIGEAHLSKILSRAIEKLKSSMRKHSQSGVPPREEDFDQLWEFFLAAVTKMMASSEGRDDEIDGTKDRSAKTQGHQ